LRLFVASWSGHALLHFPAIMRLGRRTSNLLLAAGLFTLFSWITRAYTWYANDLQDDPYLALIHFPVIVIFLAIGGYLTYLGIRGRRATRQSS
jgi:hypothetical protein